MWPVLAGHKNAVFLLIIGDAVEHIHAGIGGKIRTKGGKIDPAGYPAGLRRNAGKDVLHINIRPDFPPDKLQFIETGNRPVAVADMDPSSDFEGFRIAKDDYRGAVAHEQAFPIGSRPPAFTFVFDSPMNILHKKIDSTQSQWLVHR